jgi:hypothetical protein
MNKPDPLSPTVSPAKLLAIGLILMLVGFVLPFLMVLQKLESTFLLNAIAFASQVVGLLLGTVGVIFYMSSKKR